MTRAQAPLLAVALLACPATQVEPGFTALRVLPASLALPTTVAGRPTSERLTLLNEGTVSLEVSATVSGPFTVEPARQTVRGGGVEALTVGLTAEVPGRYEGTVQVNGVAVPVMASVLDGCASASPCRQSTFDAVLGRCVERAASEGVSCRTACGSDGRCTRGACLGPAEGCDDGNPCTVDACGESGCFTTPRVCPSSGACRRETCNPDAGGCVGAFEPVDDGTLCGADGCGGPDVQVCIGGACVARARAALTLHWERLTPSDGDWLLDEDRRPWLLERGPEARLWRWTGQAWESKAGAPRGVLCAAVDVSQRRALALSRQGAWLWDGQWTALRGGPGPVVQACSAAFDETRRVWMVAVRSYDWSAYQLDGTQWSGPLRVVEPQATAVEARYDFTVRLVALRGELGRNAWNGAAWVALPPEVSAPGGQPSSVMRALAEVATANGINPAAVPALDVPGAVTFDAERRLFLHWGQRTLRTASPVSADWAVVAQEPTVWPPLELPHAFDESRGTLVAAEAGAVHEWRGLSWRRVEDAACAPESLAWDGARVLGVGEGRTCGWEGGRWESVVGAAPPRGAALVRAGTTGPVLAVVGQGLGVWRQETSGWTRQVVEGDGPGRVVAVAHDGQLGTVLAVDEARTIWRLGQSRWEATARWDEYAPLPTQAVYVPGLQATLVSGPGVLGLLQDGSTWLSRGPAGPPGLPGLVHLDVTRGAVRAVGGELDAQHVYELRCSRGE